MSNIYIPTIIAIIIAYLLGSISTAVIACKLFNLQDPRTIGSKNPGATNVLRTGNKLAAAITLLGDFLKGFIPVFFAKWYGIPELGLTFVAFAAFIGHLYPVFFNFKGGKGVATAFGCMLGLSNIVALCVLGTWLIVAFLFRYSSLAAIISAIAAPFYTYYFTNTTYTVLISIISILLIYRHSSNIHDLITKKEDKIDD